VIWLESAVMENTIAATVIVAAATAAAIALPPATETVSSHAVAVSASVL
jgi:hypothetical protein